MAVSHVLPLYFWSNNIEAVIPISSGGVVTKVYTPLLSSSSSALYTVKVSLTFKSNISSPVVVVSVLL